MIQFKLAGFSFPSLFNSSDIDEGELGRFVQVPDFFFRSLQLRSSGIHQLNPN